MNHAIPMRIAALTLATALFGGPPPARAAVHQITGPEQSIQAAIDASAPGDTVLVAPGHYLQRLTIQDRSLTLGSWTLTTGDTLWLEQTILDGDSLGTVLRIEAGPAEQIVVDGFTVQRGFDDQWYSSGGIYLGGALNAELRHLRLRNNCSMPYGSGMATGESTTARRIKLQHIRTEGNDGILPAVTQGIFLRVNERLEVRDIILRDGRIGGGRFYSNDSIFVDGVDIRGYQHPNIALSIGAINNSSPLASGFADVRNITMLDCSRGVETAMSIGTDGILNLRNIRLEGNTQAEFVGDLPSAYLLMAYGTLGIFADSIMIRNNRGKSMDGAGAFLWRQADEYNATRPSHVQDLWVEGNVQGDSTHTPLNTSHLPFLVQINEADLRRVVFRNNTQVVAPDPEVVHPISGVWSVLLYCEAVNRDSAVFEDLLFKDNLLVDLDDIDDPENIPGLFPNRGSCMTARAWNSRVILRNLVVDGNREPRLPPERVPSVMFGYPPPNNGNLVSLGHRSYMGSPQWNILDAESLSFRGNDNGGLSIWSYNWVHLRNLSLVDLKRAGLNLVLADSFLVDGLLVDGCTPDRPLEFNSEQMPLRLDCRAWGRVRNATVRRSTTPYVVTAGLTPYGEERVPRITFENCLFADNQFQRFEAEVRAYDSWYPGWNSFRPGRFEHCLLPEAPQYGSGNLVGIDPFWDEQRGPPYLDPSSPLVDGGRDDPDWRDPEDPEQPGLALWPSLGTTRADIGVTGGPFARVVDQDWVPVAEPRRRAAGPSLGEAWPNPFNAVARIAYELPRPATVRLSVHDLLGRRVAVLAAGRKAAGRHEAMLDGAAWASGLYFVTLEAAGQAETRKVLLLK
jgi:hypothetical protein